MSSQSCLIEDHYPPLSALNDYLLCPRRCALHRLEGIWMENVHTTAGSLDHRRVHQPRDAAEGSVRIVRGVRLVSHSLRIVGVADLIEFHSAADGSDEIPYPVEYKRGRRRKWDNNEVQLCAQRAVGDRRHARARTASQVPAVFAARSLPAGTRRGPHALPELSITAPSSQPRSMVRS